MMEYTLLLMEKVCLEIVIKAGDEDYDFSLNQQQQLSDWHLGWNHCLFAVNLEQVFHLVLMSSSLNFNMLFRDVRSSSPEVFCKKVRKKSLENTCASACNFIKKETLNRCFPVNFAKFLRTTFLQNTSERLLLNR